MTISKTEDGTVSVTGESVRPMAQLARIHGWRNAANMRIKFAMTSKAYPTVKAFNAEWDTSARTWEQIRDITDGVIKELRAEVDAAIASKETN